ncbi:hypothetical protein P0E58_13855 [Enterococcus faecalis]|uniref:hypothetical protein n=1 Tax=Enterococcus faecalis TaxID=1351 RepID=UPI0025B17EF2|nr:hypothetical protein [Enterococcus faecalis]MDN3139576.1 hypothetical protein [Enterococcus faecalis]
MKKYCIFSTHHVKFFLKKLDRGETNAILKHSTAQHSTAQHSTAQHSTAQHSTAQHVNLNTRAYLAYTKIELFMIKQVFSLINEKAFSAAINRKVVA